MKKKTQGIQGLSSYIVLSVYVLIMIPRRRVPVRAS